ncbi:hypothetical protein C8A05DRAFT_37283 [Staphylotrichum tortipilum]|uniref:Uncharacterized protein n=1 Tax=Staphylotrichum tortipilum TaxID=2831512 RepID=A0AAN6MF78_9PEZI|nr:hypothetical protein C8A05DRAFT_37283 [Staphylotrichum longicolle]
MECLEAHSPHSPQSAHDFCDSPLKPEPLRIAHRTESTSSGDTCVNDPPTEDIRIGEEVPQLPDVHDAITGTQDTAAPLETTTQSLRATSPRLSALKSKFETIDTMVRPGGELICQFVVGAAASKSSTPRPALAPLDPNLTAAAIPASTGVGISAREGQIGNLDGHCDNSRGIKASITPQKPSKMDQPRSAGLGVSTGTTPAAQSVSERRKMFERLSGDGVFAAPIVAQANVHPIKPIHVDTGLVSALRSTSSKIPRSRTSPRPGGLDKRSSPQSSLRPPRPREEKNHLFLGAQKEKPFQQNNHTVADLRRTFEREPATKIARPGGSLPNTPKRTQTPKIETRIISPGSRVDKKPSVRRRPVDRDLKPFALPDRVPVSWSRAHPSRLPTPTTIRQAEGRALRANLVDELSQTVRCKASLTDRANAMGQASERVRSPITPDPQPLLVARTISVKAYTVRPVSRSSKIPRAKFPTDPLPENRNNDAEARRVAPRTAASRSLQHWKTRSPTKSSPSLPVIVSTTIGASTRSGLRQPSPLVSGIPLKSKAQRPVTPARKENVSGAAAGNAESPVRQRIFALEHLGQRADGEGMATEKAQNTASGEAPEATEVGAPTEHTRQTSVKKASGWERRLGSQTLRSFSASARRKLSGSKRRSRSPQGSSKSQITVSKRQVHTPTSERPRVPDHASEKTRLHRNFSLRATLRKISLSHHGSEAFPASPRPMSSPSAEQLAKTASIAPRPFHRIRTRSGRFLPVRNSYHGASNSKLSSGLVENDVLVSSASSWVGGSRISAQVASHAEIADPKPSMDGETQTWTRRATVAALDLGRRFRGTRKTSTSVPQSGLSKTSVPAERNSTALCTTITAPQLTTPIHQEE